MRFTLLVGLLCATAFAHGQDSGGGGAGRAGAEAGRQILQNAAGPTLDLQGGRNQAGTYTINGQSFDIADMMPGVTRSEMERMKERSAGDLDQLEREGIAEFNRTAREESSRGEATRALLDQAAAPTRADAVDMTWLEESGLARDAVSEAFADCSATAEIVNGDSLATTVFRDVSCLRVPNAYGGPATCGRAYEFEYVRPDGSTGGGDPLCAGAGGRLDSELCPAFNWGTRMVSDASCEAEATAGECTVEWTCTSHELPEVGGTGVRLTRQQITDLGLAPLYPGAVPTCVAAQARLSCPVCTDTGNGQTNCGMVDPSLPEPMTCQEGNPPGDPSCKVKERRCVMRDDADPAVCVLEELIYTCGKREVLPTSRVLLGNSCNAQIQCVDGSCHGGPATSDPSMSMQEAMARMAVTDTMLTDRSYDADGLAAVDGSGQMSARQREAYDNIRMFQAEAMTCQKGYAGLVDCCGKTNTDANAVYWEIYQRVNRDRQAARLAQEGGTSAWREWEAGRADYASLSNPFTSMRDNVQGGSGRSPEAVTMTVWEEFMRMAREVLKPSISPRWACHDSEFDLAIQREVDMCSYAGTFCSKRVLGACLKRKESYCCFKSPMSKALRASAEPGGVLNHGSASNPDCSGLPIDDLDRIDWSVIDFTRLAVAMNNGGVFDRARNPEQAAANYTGSGQSGRMAEGRQDVRSRSEERLAGIDASQVRSGIAADVQSRSYMEQAEATRAPARLSFTTSRAFGTGGRPVGVSVARQGSLGPASATVSLIAGSHDTAGFLSETLYWGDGDTSSRTVTLLPPRGAAGQVVLELTAHEGTVNGHDIITVVVE